MRCYICNKRLNTDEISLDKREWFIGNNRKYNPCTVCLDVALDLTSLVTAEEEQKYIPLVEELKDGIQ